MQNLAEKDSRPLFPIEHHGLLAALGDFHHGLLGDVIVLTLYSRPGCHLCDEMKAVVQRVMRASQVPITIEEIDISTDPALEARYGLEIPMLLVDGKKAAKYRITEDELMRLLRDRSGGAGGSGG